MSNTNLGGVVELTGTAVRISNVSQGYRHLNLRIAGTADAIISNGLTDIGQLDSGLQALQLRNVNITDVWVRGTPGELLYWNGDAA